MADISPRWYAAYTASRHEKSVFTQLNGKQIEAFLPLCRTVRRWKNRSTSTLELPLFSGYLFVRIPWRSRVDVLSTPGVLSLVGPPGEPWPLPDFEIEALRAGLAERNAEPHPYLVMGKTVRINRGPLAGMEGVLLRNKNSVRVVLTIVEISRSFSVEVDACDLEPVYSRVGVETATRSFAQSNSQ